MRQLSLSLRPQVSRFSWISTSADSETRRFATTICCICHVPPHYRIMCHCATGQNPLTSSTQRIGNVCGHTHLHALTHSLCNTTFHKYIWTRILEFGNSNWMAQLNAGRVSQGYVGHFFFHTYPPPPPPPPLLMPCRLLPSHPSPPAFSLGYTSFSRYILHLQSFFSIFQFTSNSIEDATWDESWKI